jgi:hypothetical protein
MKRIYKPEVVASISLEGLRKTMKNVRLRPRRRFQLITSRIQTNGIYHMTNLLNYT